MRSNWKPSNRLTAIQALPVGEQVDWFNNRRLLEPIGNIPPAEAEEAFHANLNELDMVA